MKKHITLTIAALSAMMASHAAGPDKNNIGITTSKNYIHTRTYTQAVSMTATADPAKAGRDDVAYYDGLGLLTHTVQVAAAPDGMSLVLPVHRNAVFNDKEREYLPYSAATATAAAQTDLFASSRFVDYGPADSSYAFTLNEYENSPLARIRRSYKSGATYQSDKNRYISYSYDANSASEVPKLTFSAGAVTANGYYAAAALFKNTTTDEDGGQIVTFADKHDKVILERRKIADNDYADTYYIYDSAQRLVCVVPPEAAKNLTSGTASLSAATVNSLCYTYTYVGDRVVSKRLPGKDPENYGYDLGKRIVLYQDGNLAAAGKAILYKYDKNNRIVWQKMGNFSGSVDTSAYPDSALDYLEGQFNTLLVSYTYDNLDTSQFSAVTGIVATTDRSSNVHSLKTYEKIAVLGDNYTASGYVERWFYYDYRGRVIQTTEKYPDGSIHRISSKYDFTDNVTASRETYTHGTTTETLNRTFSYDSRGRLKAETSTIDGVTASVDYSYDSVGRFTGKSYNGGTITETLAHNIQGWQTAQTVKKGTEVLFDNTLKYYDGTTPLYSGNISEWAWAYKGQSANTYKFSYDKMSRLLGADHFIGTTLSDKFTEKAIAYDKNSNLKSMTRYVNGTPSTFTFAYTGNKRNGYIYDANGNITSDATNNLLVSSYNFLNLPTTIKQGSTVKATYTYLADGTKIKAVNAYNGGSDYVGSFKYNRNGSNISLESVATAGGRTYKTSGGYEARYFVTDHLGSTRLIAYPNGNVIEQNDYMPYGERHSNSALATSGNPYLYNGKESQKSFGINYIDSEARFQRLDGAFNSIDPLCEKYYHISPYTYCGANPITRVDTDGLDWYSYQEEYFDAQGNSHYRTRYKYVKGQMSEDEMLLGGYTHLGQTFMTDDTYFSLGGAEIEFDKDNSMSILGLRDIIQADNSTIAAINTMEYAGNFWDKYNGFISDGSSAANILGEYMELSKKYTRVINKLGNATTYINAYFDCNKYLNGQLHGIALADAAVNVISKFGPYGATISLGYSGIKKSAGILTNLEYELRDQFNIMQKNYIRMMSGGF